MLDHNYLRSHSIDVTSKEMLALKLFKNYLVAKNSVQRFRLGSRLAGRCQLDSGRCAVEVRTVRRSRLPVSNEFELKRHLNLASMM